MAGRGLAARQPRQLNHCFPSKGGSDTGSRLRIKGRFDASSKIVPFDIADGADATRRACRHFCYRVYSFLIAVTKQQDSRPRLNSSRCFTRLDDGCQQEPFGCLEINVAMFAHKRFVPTQPITDQTLPNAVGPLGIRHTL